MKLRNKKTGEVRKMWKNNICLSFADGNSVYYTLAELNSEWEDYEPKEPLIKDEKIRKAVRAWAEGSNFQSVHYDAFWTCFRRGNSSITVWEELPLEDNKAYTIDELCGEEEK